MLGNGDADGAEVLVDDVFRRITGEDAAVRTGDVDGDTGFSSRRIVIDEGAEILADAVVEREVAFDGLARRRDCSSATDDGLLADVVVMIVVIVARVLEKGLVEVIGHGFVAVVVKSSVVSLG